MLAERGASFDTLPDELLQQELCLLPAEERRLQVPLVCSRWQRVARQLRIGWHHLRLSSGSPQGSWDRLSWSNLLAALVRDGRASHAQQLTIYNLYDELLQRVSDAPPGPFGMLFGLCSNLATVELGSLHGTFGGRELSQLTILPRLRSLSLTSLSTTDFPAPSLQHLSSLKQLTQLKVEFGYGHGNPFDGQVLDAFTRLTALRSLYLAGTEECAGECMLPAGFSAVSQLAQLTLQRMLGAAPLDVLATMQQLTSLSLLDNMVPQIPAEVAANLTGLVDLVITGNGYGDGEGIPEFVSVLTALTCLELSENGPEVAMVNWQACSQLHSLTIGDCRLSEVPLSINDLPSLRYLFLWENRLEQLPPGSYLSRLQHLDLCMNQFKSIPASLKGAPLLETVVLYGNPLVIVETDASFDILCSMPMLESFTLIDPNHDHELQNDVEAEFYVGEFVMGAFQLLQRLALRFPSKRQMLL